MFVLANSDGVILPGQSTQGKMRIDFFYSLVRDRGYWTEGWKSGDTLRLAFDSPMALQIIMANVEALIRTGMSREIAMLVTQHNVTRGLIELICASAKTLGFDAIFGHEIDRHNDNGRVIARPWLAVLNAGVLAPVEWKCELEA